MSNSYSTEPTVEAVVQQATLPPIPAPRSLHPYRRPSRRPLQIFALDPMRIDRGKSGRVTPRATVYVPFEDDLKPGPRGRRIRVIDYDGVHRCYYEPIDLNHADVLIRDGLAPTETDPRFHQQMVYAVVAGLWADFETAIGRRLTLGRKKFLTIFPHAFYGENAFYDPESSSLMFGYFRADSKEAGTNIPGQMVFTCLSHDIIVHETTHALVDRLRPDFMIASNPDVAAFHEGFADLIAIFQHFKLQEVLVPALADSRGDFSRSEVLLGLARQFGYSTGSKAALRSAEDGDPDPAKYRASEEPHERGAVLVRSVFDAFLSLYQQRTQDLIRLASEGTGVLREGALHPDLISRLAREASALANQMFTALMRAFDYLPPLDVTFEDFLRSIVTIDLLLSPSDDSFRVAIIEGFRKHGIYPTTAGSLGADSVAWGGPGKEIGGFPFHRGLLTDVIKSLDAIDPEGYDAVDHLYGAADKAVSVAPPPDEDDSSKQWRSWAAELFEFGMAHRKDFSLDEDVDIVVEGMHPTMRYRANGRPTIDIVVRYVQSRDDLISGDDLKFVPKGGCTVVADSNGVVRYVITKPLPPREAPEAEAASSAWALDATRRLTEMQDRLRHGRSSDPGDPYRAEPGGQALRINFALLHRDHDEGNDE
jgi:hypothetical protein